MLGHFMYLYVLYIDFLRLYEQWYWGQNCGVWVSMLVIKWGWCIPGQGFPISYQTHAFLLCACVVCMVSCFTNHWYWEHARHQSGSCSRKRSCALCPVVSMRWNFTTVLSLEKTVPVLQHYAGECGLLWTWQVRCGHRECHATWHWVHSATLCEGFLFPHTSAALFFDFLMIAF